MKTTQYKEESFLFWVDKALKVYAQAITQQDRNSITLIGNRGQLPKDCVNTCKPYNGKVYFYTYDLAKDFVDKASQGA